MMVMHAVTATTNELDSNAAHDNHIDYQTLRLLQGMKRLVGLRSFIILKTPF